MFIITWDKIFARQKQTNTTNNRNENSTKRGLITKSDKPFRIRTKQKKRGLRCSAKAPILITMQNTNQPANWQLQSDKQNVNSEIDPNGNSNEDLTSFKTN